MKSTGSNVRRLTVLALFAAVVAVLSALGNFVRIGPVPVTLVLAPIIIGASLYGPKAGAFLGFVFGVVTIITGIMGMDGGTVMLLMGADAFATVFFCLLKGTLAGFAAGLVYRLVEKKSVLLAVILAGIVCPVVNTATFVLCMVMCFGDILASWAGGGDVVRFVLLGMVGVNFLVELAVNMVLASGITTVVHYGKGRQA